MAFPNAYISTDEPPRRSAVARVLAGLSIIGVGYLGLLILALSVTTSEYSPVTQFASDYGVGTYATEMNAGFFVAGLGFISLAAILVVSHRVRSERVGGASLAAAGLALLINSVYTTDVEGAEATFHGAVHALGGVVFFLSAPIGLLLVSWGFGRRRFRYTLAAVGLAALFVAIGGGLALDATGLAERFMILAVFGATILTAVRVYRES